MLVAIMLARMSIQMGAVVVPEWTVGDRLRKAREAAGFKQQELADEIGISRRSVSAYELSITMPRKPVLLSWSILTGVPVEWLLSGTSPGPYTDPDGRPRQDSNLRRTVYNVGTRRASRKLVAA